MKEPPSSQRAGATGRGSARRLARFASPVLAMFAGALALGAAPLSAEVTRLPLSHRDLECVAVAAYWEARSERAEGMAAIAMVVLNRMRDPRFPAGACAVVRQGGERPGCQFSFWCDGKSDAPEDEEVWRLARRAVRDAVEHHSRGEDHTRSALFFHSADIYTPWRVEREETVRVGKHVFYR